MADSWLLIGAGLECGVVVVIMREERRRGPLGSCVPVVSPFCRGTLRPNLHPVSPLLFLVKDIGLFPPSPTTQNSHVFFRPRLTVFRFFPAISTHPIPGKDWRINRAECLSPHYAIDIHPPPLPSLRLRTLLTGQRRLGTRDGGCLVKRRPVLNLCA